MTEKYTETSKIKKPELSDVEKEWKKKKPQEKIEALSQQIGFEKLCQLFDMLGIIQGNKEESSKLKLIPKIKEKSQVGVSIQELKEESYANIIIRILELDISIFLLKRAEKESNEKHDSDCIESSMRCDGISLQFFEQVKSYYETITSVDKNYPSFIEKNPDGGPLDYFFLPTDEDKKIITTFFPNLLCSTIKIPFSIQYDLGSEGSTRAALKQVQYRNIDFLLGKNFGPQKIKINFKQVHKNSEVNLRSTLINETWHYIYREAINENNFLEQSLQGQYLSIGKQEPIALGEKINGVNEFMSDVMSIQINPTGEIRRIYEHALEEDKDRDQLRKSRRSPGYQFCVQVFSTILRDLFGSEYAVLRDEIKMSQKLLWGEEYYNPKKLQNILQDPQKMKKIQHKYMEIGYDLACRLGELKKSPAYVEKPARPNTLLDVIKMDMLGHPDGGDTIKPKMPPKDANIFGKN